ncbi:MAG: FkbM family methyltransferase [Alphaproteobacteria bacterium]
MNDDSSTSGAWTPPSSMEEKAKRMLVPPALYIKNLYRRECLKGEKEIGLVPFLAKADKLSLDIGANKGVWSYAMLPHSLGVHAFEPNPKSLEILRSWGKSKLTIHDMALSNQTGTATLYVPKGLRSSYSNQRSSLVLTRTEGHGSVTVDTKKLDDLNITNIGFMKIDVEGFEQQVLQGAAETLKRERPNLVIEIEEKHTKQRIEDQLNAVCGYGYDCFALLRGTLTPMALIDFERHHRAPATRADYVFNFIFLPRSK